MNRIKLALAAALIGASTVALAIDADAEAARRQRMDEALQAYRSGDARNPKPGPFARAEASTKRGIRKAGAAVDRTARKVGRAVATGAEKTGDALRRTGEKIQEKTAPAK